MDPRVHDLHTHKSSSDTPVKQLSWSYSKNLRKWPNQTPMQAFNALPAWKYKFTTFSNLKHDYTHYPDMSLCVFYLHSWRDCETVYIQPLEQTMNCFTV